MILRKKNLFGQSIIYIIAIVFSLFCLLPFLMVVSGSLTSEQDIMKYGFTIIPKNITTVAYKILLSKPDIIINAYMISTIVTVVGTTISVFLTSMIAYVISRKTLKYAKAMSMYCLITILFSGGMVPWYIVCINYLHLKDQLIAQIVPYLINGWYIFLMRNFFQSIPDEMHESAKIDGAGELRIFVQIILPLATPALATICLFIGLVYWNDWWLSLMLIDKENLRPIQYMLRIIVSNISFLKSQVSASPEVQRIAAVLPDEGLKMATCIVTMGPIILLYPFLQRFFIKGIMIGAVKG